MIKAFSLLAFVALIADLVLLPSRLFSQSGFYQGKTVTVVASTAPGGTGDLRDPEFHREYRKVVSDEADPMMAEELTKVIAEMPRDPEVIDLLKKISGPSPLPPR